MNWWTTTGAELADCDRIAVYPVSWWRERKHLGCIAKQARYALIVSIETAVATVDLYTPIAQQIDVPVPVAIDIDGAA